MFPGEELVVDGEIVGMITEVRTTYWPGIRDRLDVKLSLFSDVGKSKEFWEKYKLVLVSR